MDTYVEKKYLKAKQALRYFYKITYELIICTG